jgi:hypothetical protein
MHESGVRPNPLTPAPTIAVTLWYMMSHLQQQNSSRSNPAVSPCRTAAVLVCRLAVLVMYTTNVIRAEEALRPMRVHTADNE